MAYLNLLTILNIFYALAFISTCLLGTYLTYMHDRNDVESILVLATSSESPKEVLAYLKSRLKKLIFRTFYAGVVFTFSFVLLLATVGVILIQKYYLAGV